MITQEEKAKIFALYWGVTALKSRTVKRGIPALPVGAWERMGLPQQYLELKPISSISDEDAIKISKLLWTDRDELHTVKDGKFYIEALIDPEFDDEYYLTDLPLLSAIKVIDFLRSRGYALPYMNHSVNELVEAGIFKLIEP